MLKRSIFSAFFVLALSLLSVFCFANKSQAASGDPVFIIAPSAGIFPVGSTFDVNIGLNTKGNTINAFSIRVVFPADKLQVVSSGTGKSITGFWIRRPIYSNEAGYLDLEGAVPSPGINTDFGIITTVTFRVKALGDAAVRFDRTTTLYLNDGQGTPINTVFQDGLFKLVLPPPQGPFVTSSTHPDQDRWYNRNDVVLQWANGNTVAGYSYVLNQTPIDMPDNTIDSTDTSTVYKGLTDGVHYFHIKALRDGVWGGVTHFGLKIQIGSPAGFNIEVNPGKRTASKTIVFNFQTTDMLSGIDHYEAKIIRLDAPQGKDQTDVNEPLFFEVQNPYVFNTQEFGRYKFIVRAFNKAGNYTEESVKVSVVKPFLQFIDTEGLHIGNFSVPWYLFWPIATALVIGLIYYALHIFRWHVRIEMTRAHVSAQAQEHSDVLSRFKERLGLLKSVMLMVFVPALLFAAVYGANASQLSPPVVNLISKNINNDEIFYIGGRAASGNGGIVIIYLESLSTGETQSFQIPVSPSGDWFYTHPAFLTSGNYIIWTQLQIGDITSPPSSQTQMTVSPKAFQLGASRLSLETLYFVLFLLFVALAVSLAVFITLHYRSGHDKYRRLTQEIREAEQAIKHGFTLLQRDVQAEIDVLHNLKSARELSGDELAREKQLLQDMSEIGEHIEKEVWDIEKALGSHLG